MSFNSKAFLADRERLLEPDQELHGSYRRHKELRQTIYYPPQPEPISEEEDNRRQDEYLKSKGII